MRRISGDTGIRGGDRGGRQERPLEVCDDSVSLGAEGAGFEREEYTNENGQRRVRIIRK